MFHAPYYNTYVAHYKQVECFRVDVEPLLFEAGVDLVLSGAALFIEFFIKLLFAFHAHQ